MAVSTFRLLSVLATFVYIRTQISGINGKLPYALRLS